MKFSRLIITPGALAFVLLAAGCAALTESDKPTTAHAPGGVSDRTEDSQDATKLSTTSASITSASTTSAATSAEAATNSHEAGAGRRAGNPADTIDDSAAGVEPVAAVTDLWQRLRNNFQLANLEHDQRRLHYFEKWYSARPRYFARLTERARWFLPHVLDEVEKRGMPGEIALLPAIESAFRLDAVSPKRAVGLWQFIASTGRRYGLRQNWWVDGRRDFVLSTQAALNYLDFLEKEFDGDWELALASYNAGEGAVRRQVKRNLKRNQPANYQSLKLRRETRDYIPKLFAVRNIINRPEKFGITLKHIPNRPTLAVVDAKSQTDLGVAAALAGISSKELRRFNQSYKRGTTPPSGPHILVVPVEYAADMRDGLDNISVEERLRWARYQVRTGDYLGRIAAKYGVSVASITRTNRLTSSLIHPGQALRIPLSTGRYQFAEAATGSHSPPEAGKVYMVKRGDSLWRIARRYGVSIAKLTSWNRISRSALLHPGQSLVVAR